MKCPRCGEYLAAVMARRSVVVDACPNGHGVWLDGGEKYHFVDHPREFGRLLARGLLDKQASEILCLKCVDIPMEKGLLVEQGDPLDACPRCGGMWFDAAEMTVAALLKKIKVSNVRPVLASLKGKVIGRGVPGLIWSEDVVLQDETGFIFADYRQPLHMIELWIGLFRTDRFIGKDVAVVPPGAGSVYRNPKPDGRWGDLSMLCLPDEKSSGRDHCGDRIDPVVFPTGNSWLKGSPAYHGGERYARASSTAARS